ncbi:MAG TPA: hypothetical protein VGK64_17490 [Bryobacteraceae bacterium]
MKVRQFGVLYREFLFRLVDRDVLSIGAQGDASKLLGRLAAILLLIGIPFAFSALGIGDSRESQQVKFVAAWGAEHALIATTMLIVGLFAVLSWDSAYPDRRDAMVLGPLPIRASTIFLSKIVSLAVALSLTVAIFNAPSAVVLPIALAPREATPLDWLVSLQFYRALAAYWITMFISGAFVFCAVLVVQGVAAQLPRRLFLRLSAILQLAAFCIFLAGYFLEPSLASRDAIAAPANRLLLLWLPSYWFLGLFQQCNGSLADGSTRPILLELAARAWIGFGAMTIAAACTFLLSYFRTLRKIVEQPDIVPGSRRFHWLPSFGNSMATAITQFSVRSLIRSRQHRVLLSFYSGIGFAVVILFLKTPVARHFAATSAGDPWHRVNTPLLASSFVMLCAWILGTRVVFAIPLELRANWIFRITQVQPAAEYFAASRRAAYALALAPAWCTSAVLFFSLWPWPQALGHLAVLVLLGTTIVECWLYSFRKVPFTCSYLPGKSNLHITFLLCLLLGLNATLWSADWERRALADLPKYLWIVAVLGMLAALAWLRRAREHRVNEDVRFEEDMPPAITSLGL